MNSVFLIGEILNDINLQTKDGIEYTTNFVIKNGINEFEIQCAKELAREVCSNTSKGDIVAIQGRLCKHKNDINKIIIVASSIQEFRNEKTNAKIANEISQTNNNTSNNIFKNMDKYKISELFNEIAKIINIVNDTNTNEEKIIIKNNEEVQSKGIENKEIQKLEEIKVPEERKDAQTLV